MLYTQRVMNIIAWESFGELLNQWWVCLTIQWHHALISLISHVLRMLWNWCIVKWKTTMFLHSTESLTGKTHGRSCVLWSTRQVTSLPLSAGVGTKPYSLRTVTVPSGLLMVVVEWFPPTDASHLMVAAGFPSAASHWATTTDLELAWTVTILAEFFGLAKRAKRNRNTWDRQIWKTGRLWKLSY